MYTKGRFLIIAHLLIPVLLAGSIQVSASEQAIDIKSMLPPSLLRHLSKESQDQLMTEIKAISSALEFTPSKQTTLSQSLNQYISGMEKDNQQLQTLAPPEVLWLIFAIKSYILNGDPTLADKKLLSVQLQTAKQNALQLTAQVFPDLDEITCKRILESYFDRLRLATETGLDPAFRFPITPAIHQKLIQEWNQLVLDRKIDPLRNFGIYRLDQRKAPLWEVNQIHAKTTTMISSILTEYGRLRATHYTPSDERLVRIQHDFQNALTALRATEKQKNRNLTTEKERLEALEEYEMISAIYDMVLGPTVPLIECSGKGEWIPSRGAGRFSAKPYRQTFTATSYYQNPGHSPKLPTTTSGVLLVNDHRYRCEVTSRTPLWMTRGLCYEPIGLTLDKDDLQLQVYFPGIMKYDILAFPCSMQTQEILQSPLAISRDLRINAIAQNRIALMNPATTLKEPGMENDLFRVKAQWGKNTAWFYHRALGRAEYQYKQIKGMIQLESVRLFAQDADALLAKISFHDPFQALSGHVIYSTIRAEIMESAFLNTDENRLQEQDNHAVSRTIIWHYSHQATGTSETVWLKSCQILKDKNKELDLQLTSPNIAPVLFPDTLEKPVRLTQLGGSTVRNNYYLLLKERFEQMKSNHAKLPKEWIAQAIIRASAIEHEAKSKGDYDVQIAIQHWMLGWYSMTHDPKAWGPLASRHLADLHAHADDKQYWICASSLTDTSIANKWPGECALIMKQFQRHQQERVGVLELLSNGSAMASAATYAEAIVCYNAACSKLSVDCPLYKESTTAKDQLVTKWKEQLSSIKDNEAFTRQLFERIQ